MLSMPPWYTQSVVTIMFTVWGISVTAPVVGSIFSGLSLVGTNYNDAVRLQAVSVLNSDKATEHALRLIVSRGKVSMHVGTTYANDGHHDLVD